MVYWFGWQRWIYASSNLGMLKPTGMVAEGLVRDVLIEVSAGLALVGYRRLAGASGIAWISIYLLETLNMPAWSFGRDRIAADVHWLSLIALPLAFYVVMLVVPRVGPLHPRRIGWLFGALLLAGLAAPPDAPLAMPSPLAFSSLLTIVVLIMGMRLLAVDAWRPVAFALALTPFALASWTLETSSIHRLGESLNLMLTTFGPLILIIGAAARLLSTLRPQTT